jgi:FkbM family methyltransferase
MQRGYLYERGQLVKGQKDVQRKESERFDRIIRIKHIGIGRGVAIDGGAHVGSWTVRMARHFDVVHAFEPCWASYSLLCENIINSDLPGEVIPHNKALMDQECLVNVVQPSRNRTALTARQVKVSRRGRVEAVSIDSLNLERCDFIKLDLEGSEMIALEGARKTIKKFHPVLVIEFNGLMRKFGSSEDQMKKRLEKMGYREVWRESVDRVFKWYETQSS